MPPLWAWPTPQDWCQSPGGRLRAPTTSPAIRVQWPPEAAMHGVRCQADGVAGSLIGAEDRMSQKLGQGVGPGRPVDHSSESSVDPGP